MRAKERKIKKLERLFKSKSCLTINELRLDFKCSEITARRRLASLEYYTSYNQNGKWYTIAPIPEFDGDGLWRYGSIFFSKHGTLPRTIIHFVDASAGGITVGQLSKKLGLTCYSALTQLYKKGAIERVKQDSGFVYVSTDVDHQKRQLAHWPEIEKLMPQVAVLALVEYIKSPDASFEDISKALNRRHVSAPIEGIKRLFEEHDLKKNRLKLSV